MTPPTPQPGAFRFSSFQLSRGMKTKCWTDVGFAGPRVAHATQVRVAVVGARSRTRSFTAQKGAAA